MSSSATGVGMPICFLGAILLILTQKSSQKFGDVLGILYWLSTRLDIQTVNLATASLPTHTCFTILLLFDCKIFSVISGGFVQVRCIASPHTFRTALLYGHRTNPM